MVPWWWCPLALFSFLGALWGWLLYWGECRIHRLDSDDLHERIDELEGVA